MTAGDGKNRERKKGEGSRRKSRRSREGRLDDCRRLVYLRRLFSYETAGKPEELSKMSATLSLFTATNARTSGRQWDPSEDRETQSEGMQRSVSISGINDRPLSSRCSPRATDCFSTRARKAKDIGNSKEAVTIAVTGTYPGFPSRN